MKWWTVRRQQGRVTHHAVWPHRKPICHPGTPVDDYGPCSWDPSTLCAACERIQPART